MSTTASTQNHRDMPRVSTPETITRRTVGSHSFHKAGVGPTTWRRHARSRDAERRCPLIRVLSRAQAWTSEVGWLSMTCAEEHLDRTHALLTPSEAEESGVILLLPTA